MPGCRRVRNLRRAFLASGRRDLFFCRSKVNIEQDDPSSWYHDQHKTPVSNWFPLTLFVALCNVQIDSSLSSRSPRVYGKELPFAIAEATADFRKSIEHQSDITDIKKRLKRTNEPKLSQPTVMEGSGFATIWRSG